MQLNINRCEQLGRSDIQHRKLLISTVCLQVYLRKKKNLIGFVKEWK